MTTKRKVRADFDKSQPITVNVGGCSEDVKKQVQQAFFDVGIGWSGISADYRHLSASSYGWVYTPQIGGCIKDMFYSDDILSEGITPAEFFTMVYEEEPQGHPHAELMMQYAEDAKTHAEPWKLWQLKNKKQLEWFDCTFNPNWDIDLQYRRKIKTHLVHGVEVPDLRVKPKRGDFYYVVDIYTKDNFILYVSYDDSLTPLLSERGLCYEYTEAGKQAAILHAKIMLGTA